MFERFNYAARRAVVLAQEESRLLKHNYVSTEHILLALTCSDKGPVLDALEARGITTQAVREAVIEIVGTGNHEVTGHIPFTPRGKLILQDALAEALQLNHGYIGEEHLLLALTTSPETCVAARALARLNVNITALRDAVLENLKADGPTVVTYRVNGYVILNADGTMADTGHLYPTREEAEAAADGNPVTAVTGTLERTDGPFAVAA